MNRRDAIRHATLAAGATLLGLHLPVRSWAALAAPAGWSSDDEKFFDLVGDTIIPTTKESPGAGAVGIGRFMLTMATECYPTTAAETLRRGLREIEEASRAKFSRDFGALLVPERERLLLDYEQQKGATNAFRLMKELTLRGYFTSEIGATQALRYLPVPGGYVGSLPLKKGERSWAL